MRKSDRLSSLTSILFAVLIGILALQGMVIVVSRFCIA